MQPDFSIIIPCYNQGAFLQEAINSVLSCDDRLYELIIVNDGSTDPATMDVFTHLEQQGFTIIHKENGGLASARNAGIEKAVGKYILPLDADNKIRPGYMLHSKEVLDRQAEIGVVYGDAAYFGERQGEWRVGAFNLQRLMIANYIDACAVIRKTVFDQLGGYDVDLKTSGVEDWELWLRCAFNGIGFYYVNEIVFDYRVLNTSMSKTYARSYEKRNYFEEQIQTKYNSFLGKDWIVLHFVSRFKKNPILFIGKLILISWFPAWYQKLLRKNKIVKGI
jgi:glycosyltransferase involved in cell wall biosynthesis